MNNKKSNTITIFSTLKPPINKHILLIQKNAITSWLKLQPMPEIIIYNKKSELNNLKLPNFLKIIENFKCNDEDLPYVNDMFFHVQSIASNNVLLYINADMLLSQNLITTLNIVLKHFDHFLVIGRRWDMDIASEIDFENSLWYKSLGEKLNYKLHESTAMDYFLFTKGYWSQIPPFVIGRAGWDNGMINMAINENRTIIDATYNIRVLHQNHNYNHTLGKEQTVWSGKSAQSNYSMIGGALNAKTINDAGWLIVNNKIIKKNTLLQISEYPDIVIKKLDNFTYNQKARMLFQEQINFYLKKGFCEEKNLTYLQDLGFIVKFIIENDKQLQINWLKEKNYTIDYDDFQWRRNIVKKQIEFYKPDIVFFTDTLIFDSDFILKLNFRPKLIIAWFANSDIPEFDLSEFDLVLSSDDKNLTKFLKYGAQSVKEYISGFALGNLDKLNKPCTKKKKQYDILVYDNWAQLKAEHKDIIKTLAKESINNDKFSFGFVSICDKNLLPKEVQKCHISNHKSECVSLNYFKMAHICVSFGFNSEIGSKSIFEITGLGKFLLIEFNERVAQFFEPGKEIELFYNKADLINKIYYYLYQTEAREEIAKSGHKKCLKDHSMVTGLKKLSQIINKFLVIKNDPHIRKQIQIKQENYLYAEKKILQAISELKKENIATALEILLEITGKFPKHPIALKSLSEIHSNLGQYIPSINYIKKAYSYSPFNKEIIITILSIFKDILFIKERKIIIDRYLKQFPDDKEVKQLLSRL